MKVAPSGGGDPITPPAESKGLTDYTQANINDWQPTVAIALNRETSGSMTPTVLSIPWSSFIFYPILSFPDYPLESGNSYRMGVTFDSSTYPRVKDPILMVFNGGSSVLVDALGTYPDPDINSKHAPDLQPVFEKNGRGRIDVYIAFTDKYTDEKFYVTLLPTKLQ